MALSFLTRDDAIHEMDSIRYHFCNEECEVWMSGKECPQFCPVLQRLNMIEDSMAEKE